MDYGFTPNPTDEEADKFWEENKEGIAAAWNAIQEEKRNKTYYIDPAKFEVYKKCCEFFKEIIVECEEVAYDGVEETLKGCEYSGYEDLLAGKDNAVKKGFRYATIEASFYNYTISDKMENNLYEKLKYIIENAVATYSLPTNDSGVWVGFTFDIFVEAPSNFQK